MRLESKQRQLDTHLNRLTDTLVLGIRPQDIFYDIYTVATYVNQLPHHIKEVNTGLFTLLNTNNLHPSLVSWSQLSDEIIKLRQKALRSSKELILENDSDIFPSKADFFAFPTGMLYILIPDSLFMISTKMKLYKFIVTSVVNTKYQFLIDNENKYLPLIGIGRYMLHWKI